jgi:hypothetical protein
MLKYNITKECTAAISHPTAMERQLHKHSCGRRKTYSDQCSLNWKHSKQVLKDTENNTSKQKQWFIMGKGINVDLLLCNKDTNGVKSDKQKTDSTWLTIFHQNVKRNKAQMKWTCMSPVVWPTTDTVPYRSSLTNPEIQNVNIDNWGTR